LEAEPKKTNDLVKEYRELEIKLKVKPQTVTKMRIFIFLSVSFFSINAFAGNVKDSLFVKMLNLNENSLIKDVEYSNYIYEGIDLLSKDSIASGVEKLSKGIVYLDKKGNTKRIGNYAYLEFVSLLELSVNKETSENQKELLFRFLHALFTSEKIDVDKIIVSKGKKNNTVELTNRITLLCNYLNQDENATLKLLDQLLKNNPKSLAANVLKAEILYNQKKWEASKSFFSKAIELFPEYATGYVYRGMCNENLMLIDSAKKDIEYGIKLFPEYPFAINELGVIYLNSNEIEIAKVFFRKAKDLNPYFIWPINNLGLCFSMTGEKDSSLYYYNQAIELSPLDPEEYKFRGDMYTNNGDEISAIADYTKSINLAPGNPSFFIDRGFAYEDLKKYDEAIADFNKAIELDSNSFDALYHLGYCNYFKNSFQQAIEYLSRALMINPDDYYAIRVRGFVYYDVNDYTKSISDISRCIEKDTLNYWNYYIRGSSYYFTQKYKEADADLKMAFKLNDTDYRILDRLAECHFAMKDNFNAINYIDLGQTKDSTNLNTLKRIDLLCDIIDNYEISLSYINSLVKKHPDNKVLLLARAKCYMNSNEFDRALDDYKKAIESPELFDSFAYCGMGYCYMIKSEYDDAIKCLKKAIELNPKNDKSYLYIGSCYSHTNDYQQAITNYEIAYSMEPKLYHGFGNLGWAYYCVNDFKKCMYYSKKEFLRNDDALYAKFNYALATLRLNEIKEAHKLYKEYYDEAIHKKIDIAGAITDLKDLIEKDILKDEASYILTNIMNEGN
jgi:tetratricopeptide (TPR) repeat protein